MAEPENIYNMALHQEIEISHDTFVRRVSGGWLYIDRWKTNATSVFVPLNPEFRSQENPK